ncbi:hypothetical protein [Chishuiella changwenlii]|uniref:hypothetical protein n=1 Tax=Chishuiella changwenlii TaxID=1434701 RepID=UPI002FDAAC7D
MKYFFYTLIFFLFSCNKYKDAKIKEQLQGYWYNDFSDISQFSYTSFTDDCRTCNVVFENDSLLFYNAFFDKKNKFITNKFNFKIERKKVMYFNPIKHHHEFYFEFNRISNDTLYVKDSLNNNFYFLKFSTKKLNNFDAIVYTTFINETEYFSSTIVLNDTSYYIDFKNNEVLKGSLNKKFNMYLFNKINYADHSSINEENILSEQESDSRVEFSMINKKEVKSTNTISLVGYPMIAYVIPTFLYNIYNDMDKVKYNIDNIKSYKIYKKKGVYLLKSSNSIVNTDTKNERDLIKYLYSM